MSWVRLDDSFTTNPKIVQLSDADFRVWVRLLCHCSRVEDPTVDDATRREVAGLTKRRAERFETLGLLDSIGDAHEVHDWAPFRAKDTTNADRQRRWRARKRAEGNGVTGVTEAVTKGVTSLARAPVPEPVPVPEKAGNEVFNGYAVARPEGLPVEKQRLAVQLKSVALCSEDGARMIDKLCNDLPEGSLAKVLESAVAKKQREPIGPGYVIAALRSERTEQGMSAA